MSDHPLEIVLVIGGIILLIGLFAFVEIQETPNEPDSLFETPVTIKKISSAPLFYMAPPTNSFQIKTYKDWGYQEPAYDTNS